MTNQMNAANLTATVEQAEALAHQPVNAGRCPTCGELAPQSPAEPHEAEIREATNVAINAFWQSVGESFADLPGDYQEGALDQDFADLARTLVADWRRDKTPAKPEPMTAWAARIRRYAELMEHHEVAVGMTLPVPEDLAERADYALVVEGHDSDGPALLAFETFGELCEYASDVVLGADLLVAAYDLARIRPIGLHVSTPVVTESEDPGSAPVNPWK